MNKESKNVYSDLTVKLFFRRQFLLGKDIYLPNNFWNSIKLKHNLNLSVHKDLSVSIKSESNTLICLIGLAIDPFNPKFSESDIINSIYDHQTNINELIERFKPIGGRWIVIFQNEDNTFLFNDPAGLRSIYYTNDDNNNNWCGSQPEIIKTQHKLKLSTNENLLQFLHEPELAKRESIWIGTKTIYDNCYHLMPNHYLELNTVRQIRFYPNKSLIKYSHDEVLKLASDILKGSLKSISLRFNFALALTSGIDSRVLLAATKDFKQKVKFYIDKMGVLDNKHPDIAFPKKIASKFGINFKVFDSKYYPPGWFISIISNNVTNARVLPKTKSIYNKFLTWKDTINVSGNVSPINKSVYFKKFKGNPNDISIEEMAKLYGYKNNPFVIHEIEKWKNSLTLNNDLHVLDMLYWEHKLLNWGAQYPAEQDIAVDEVTPYNCRLLIEILQSTPRELRTSPNYILYRELIKYMWPEILSVPIFSGPKEKWLVKFKQKIKPHFSAKMINFYRQLFNKEKQNL